jgi:3-dehydroquinate dehydratase II
MRLLLINGPNLNNIGIREPEIYGNIGFSGYFDNLKQEFSEHTLEYFHSHSESTIAEKLHEAKSGFEGVVLNAGAYSHTSVLLRDAIAAVPVPVVLVHISNVYSREKFRHQNLIAPVCKGIITGFGIDSYRLAILSLIQ